MDGNMRVEEFRLFIKQELEAANKSPYDEWANSMLAIRELYDELFGEE